MHTFRSIPTLTGIVFTLTLIGCGQQDSLSGGSSLIGGPPNAVNTPTTSPSATPPARPIDIPDDEEEDDSDSDEDSLNSLGNNCFSKSTNSAVTKIELKAARVELQTLGGAKRFSLMANATFDYLRLAQQLNSAFDQLKVPDDNYGTIHITIASLTATVLTAGGTKAEQVPVQFTGEGFVVHLRKPGLIISKGKRMGALDIPTCGNIHVFKNASGLQVGADSHFYGQSVMK